MCRAGVDLFGRSADVPLLDLQSASIEYFKAEDSCSLDALRERVDRRLLRKKSSYLIRRYYEYLRRKRSWRLRILS